MVRTAAGRAIRKEASFAPPSGPYAKQKSVGSAEEPPGDASDAQFVIDGSSADLSPIRAVWVRSRYAGVSPRIRSWGNLLLHTRYLSTAPFLCEPDARGLLRECITLPSQASVSDRGNGAVAGSSSCNLDVAGGGRRFLNAICRAEEKFHGAVAAPGGRRRLNSRRKNRRRGVWQRRFWEHVIRDPEDFNNHIDYVHYNPVKHDLASCPHAWPHSTFRRLIKSGMYEQDWCCSCDDRVVKPPEFKWIRRSTAME